MVVIKVCEKLSQGKDSKGQVSSAAEGETIRHCRGENIEDLGVLSVVLGEGD